MTVLSADRVPATGAPSGLVTVSDVMVPLVTVIVTGSTGESCWSPSAGAAVTTATGVGGAVVAAGWPVATACPGSDASEQAALAPSTAIARTATAVRIGRFLCTMRCPPGRRLKRPTVQRDRFHSSV